jgi:glutamate synthase (NADPH/NADH) small chain
LSIDHGSVTTKEIELAIIERGFKENYVKPMKPKYRLAKRVAIIGSGPSGLAAAQELNKKGINVTVFEKDYEPGGLLRLGIPDYKIEKDIIDRRIKLLKAEGIEFICNTEVGVDLAIDELQEKYDAICLANGFTVPRAIDVDGKELKGIYFALDYLKQQNLLNAGMPLEEELINAKDKNVLIIGGGDTGADCLGIAIRQGAQSIHQIEILSKPPKERSVKTPWPYWPHMLRKNTAHEEGGKRSWDTLTQSFKGKEVIESVICSEVNWESIDGQMNMTIKEKSDYEIKADLVIIAAGFIDTKNYGMYETLGIKFGERNNIMTENHMTSVEGIFATGDLKNGPSLICKAISDGREASINIYNYLK